MSNTALISFKIGPEYYAVLKAMANSQHKSISQFVRETVVEALDLEDQAERLASFFAKTMEELEG